ncbi:MAG TPA: hypothetical protein PKE20_10450, partial [Promineifilum sp.]|nr:hypothetical protein [Promineifilum sp.]
MEAHNWRRTIRIGLLVGVIVLLTCMVGMVEAFNERDLITGVLTLGQVLLFAPAIYAGYLAVGQSMTRGPAPALLRGLIAGLCVALPVIGLILVAGFWTNIREYFVNISPALIKTLTFGRGTVAGSLMLAGVMAVLGLLGSALHLLPGRFR